MTRLERTVIYGLLYMAVFAALVAVLIFPSPAWADWGNAAAAVGISWLINTVLTKWPGILLILVAMAGFIIVSRKHRDATAYKFTLNKIWDVWTMFVITLCLILGLWLFVRDEVKPEFVSEPIPTKTSWWERIKP